MRVSIFLLLLVLALPATAQSPDAPVRLPARFDAGRVFLTPVTETGDTLALFADSGGGFTALFGGATFRLGLAVEQIEAEGQMTPAATLPSLRAGAWIPAPQAFSPLGERFVAMPAERTAEVEARIAAPVDGFLGRWWFADRTWTIDYPNREVWLRPPGDLPAGERIALGFQTDGFGGRSTHLPRIPVVIAGDTLHMLLATGAFTTLSDSAVHATGGPAARAASYISAAVFEDWRQKHPAWRVLEHGEAITGAHLIEVPDVRVGQMSLGPVWFVTRPDAYFRRNLSGLMDRVVVGAVGGSALQHVRLTLDYPGASAVFERP
jgi:hypothetical protein